MKAVGLKHPDSIMAGNIFIMDVGGGHFLKINVNGDWLEPYRALHHPHFDIETLSKIRTLAFEKLKEFWAEIEKAKVHLEKSRAERDRKVKTVLPAIIDEFGADVMQYGPPAEKQKKDHAVFPETPIQSSGIELGYIHHNFSSGGNADNVELQEKLDELQKRFDELRPPSSDCGVKP